MAPTQKLCEYNFDPATLKFNPSESWGGYIEIDQGDLERWRIAKQTEFHKKSIRGLIQNLSHTFVPTPYHDKIEYIEHGSKEKGIESLWSYGWKYVPGRIAA